MKKEILINGDPLPFCSHVLMWGEDPDKKSVVGFKGPSQESLGNAKHTKVSIKVYFVDSQDEILGDLWATPDPNGGTHLSINIKDAYLDQWGEACEEFKQELLWFGYLPFSHPQGFGDFSALIYEDIIVAYRELLQQGKKTTDEKIASRIPTNPSTGARYSREWVNKCRKKLRKAGFEV